MLTLDVLEERGGLRHGFMTRRGGLSGGVYESLNCGYASGDDRDTVTANRARAMARLGLPADALATVSQVHGTEVRLVDAANGPAATARADGMVTRTPGVALGILTADCAPVLFADADEGVIGAAHAGWRGALAGVLDRTLAAMERLGARRERVVGAIGPCIAQASYEVGPEFPAPFLADDAGSAAYFTAADRPGHFRFDLAGYVAGRLARLGLAAVEAAEADTCVDEARFFSYRRATLRGEADFGRLLSAIALQG